jgi:hypothetical protein
MTGREGKEMVAVMEVSEKDIETLRAALTGTPVDHDAIVRAYDILDRLSPPAPEVDEATVWARKVIVAWAFEGKLAKDDLYLDAAQLNAARAAIAELIASKDAEIERRIEELFDWEKIAKRTKEALTGAEDELRVCYSELATLRAENEPPAGYKHIKLACKNTIFDFNRLNRPDGTWILLDGVNVNVTPKAAERNTAEPEPFKRPTDPTDKQWDEWTSPPGTNAGAVEVTEGVATEWGDHEKRVEAIWREQRIAFVTQGAGLGDDPSPKAILSRALTEAEARGRREALEGISEDTRKWVDRERENAKNLISGTIKSGNMTLHYAAHDAFKALDELKCLMTGEK